MDCYKTVFISDLHLGSPWCRAKNLLSFLAEHSFDRLYLVGDILDNWHLRRGHTLNKQQLLVWSTLLELSKRKEVIYLVGNHDSFLEADQPYYSLFKEAFAGMHLCRRTIHTTANGRRYLVEHGDAYDVALRSSMVNVIATCCYEVSRSLLSRIAAATSRSLINLARTEDRVLRWQTWLTSLLSDARYTMLAQARRLGLDGVICGHTHLAALQTIDGLVYANCGYWTGPCHALVEDNSGELSLIKWGQAWDQAELAAGNAPA